MYDTSVTVLLLRLLTERKTNTLFHLTKAAGLQQPPPKYPGAAYAAPLFILYHENIFLEWRLTYMEMEKENKDKEV